MTRPISHRRGPAPAPDRREGGFTLALTALLLVPIMLLAALSIDVGSWYMKAQEMQRAADAAALAGVPFMPDYYDDAVDIARGAAAKNGFAHGVDGVTVDVQPVQGNRRRLQVTITDPNVTTYFGAVVRSKITVTRSAIAEYVLPVPLGSPRNFLGTGPLISSAPENLYASINGYCTSKIQGDQRASFYYNADTSADCTGTPNQDYTDTNYQYSIELPATRAYATDVILYDGNYDPRDTDPATYGTQAAALDQATGGSDADMSTTFTLYQPDQTPLDDFDNPSVESAPAGDVVNVECSSTGTGHKGTYTFGPRQAEGGYTFNPTGITSSSKWWQLCRIPATAPGGRYILRVTNGGNQTQGTNNFGIVATPSSPQRLCDARTDTTCPKVYANEYLSVRAASGGATANFYLSEIGSEHKGKKVVITLWDAGEGGQTIKIRKPATSTTWTDQIFSWTATNNNTVDTNQTSGTNVSQINISDANDFNGELITITFTLPTTYSPPPDNKWWQIAYTFASQVTDRTTWSVNIVGDPVHLVG